MALQSLDILRRSATPTATPSATPKPAPTATPKTAEASDSPTGAPVRKARRAAPVWAAIGHSSGSKVMVPSG